MCKPGESCLGCCHAGVFYVYNNAPPVMDLLLCRYNYAKEYFCWLNIEFFFSLIFPSKTPSPIWPSCTLSASRVHYSWLFGLLGVCPTSNYLIERIVCLKSANCVHSPTLSREPRNYSKIPAPHFHAFHSFIIGMFRGRLFGCGFLTFVFGKNDFRALGFYDELLKRFIPISICIMESYLKSWKKLDVLR